MTKYKHLLFRMRFFSRPHSSDLPFRRVSLLLVFLQALVINVSKSQSLDEYLQIAAENNPEVKAYFNEYLAAMEQTSQAGALPDPELSVGFFFKPMDRFMGRQQADIQLMQMFPWFGMQGSQRNEAEKMSLVRFEVFEDAKNRLFFEVKSTWYEMYRLKEEIRILQENIEILKTYERLALIRFQNAGTGAASGGMSGRGGGNNSGTATGASMEGMNAGNSSATTTGSTRQNTSPSSGASSAPMGESNSSGMSDVLRIRIQIKSMERDLASLKDSQALLKAEFNQWLNRRYDEEVVVADTLKSIKFVVERMALLDSITQNNPMLKMLDAEIDAYGSQREMARYEGRPMLGVGVNYMPFAPRKEDGMTMGGKDMVMPMVSVTLPIYRKKYNAMAKEAELNQLAVQQRKENAINQLAVQWRSSLLDLDDAFRDVTLYNEQTELARQALKLLLVGYSTNGQDFEEVLQIQQQLLDYQLKLINALVKQHTAIARLEMLAATELTD